MENLFETYRGTIYPWNLDHMGHLNVRFYADIFDHATWQLFGVMGLTPSYLREQNKGLAGLTQKTEYKKELFAGDLVKVQSGFLEIQEKTVRFFHHLKIIENNKIAATTEFLTIYMDKSTRKPHPFPLFVLEKVQSLI